MANIFRRKYWRGFCIDRGDYRKTVFLAGSGRSGTTWAEDIINFDGSYRLMFEPFHPRVVKQVADWNVRQYIRPDDTDPRYLIPAEQILSGRIRDKWIDRFNKKRFPAKRLIKDIRAHLFLRWMKNRFPEIPVILLLRHPCAVAHSRLKMGWGIHLEAMLSQQALVDDHMQPFMDVIASADTEFEQHILMWCIESYLPLRQFNPGELHILFYEDLCLQPEHAIRGLMNFIGEKYAPAVLKQLGTPSSLALSHSAINTGDDLVENWQAHITAEQQQQALYLLQQFGLDVIYDLDALPHANSENALSTFQNKSSP